jgi:hypothetical protein
MICGRELSNPVSIRRGVGPVCAGRNYRNRIFRRYGSISDGWNKIEEWEAVNKPCYSCKFFSVPPKGGEVETDEGWLVRFHGMEQTFTRNSIGGYCSNFTVRTLVDGNRTNQYTACHGDCYIRRSDEPPLEKGTLNVGNRQLEINFAELLLVNS